MPDSDTTPLAAPAFDRHIELADIPREGERDISFVANKGEEARLAVLLDAMGVAKLRFEGRIGYDRNNQLVLSAHIGATVTQSCVVTLDPVRTRIEEDVTRRYVKETDVLAAERQLLPEDDDTIEPLVDPIDIGVVVTETIALALPTYPRAEGAALKDSVFAEPGVAPLTDDEMKPFWVLRR